MGTVFLPIPVVRSWESYKSQIVNDVCKVLCFASMTVKIAFWKQTSTRKTASLDSARTRRLSSGYFNLLQILTLVPLKIKPICVINKKATVTSGRQTNCLDIHHNSFKNYVWLTARWTWGFSATPLQIVVGWQRYTEP